MNSECTEEISPTATRRRGFYGTALLATLFLKLPILAWLTFHALPSPTADAALFRLGAVEFLQHGRFAISCAAGTFPYADELYGFYPPLYVYLNAAWFGLLGFSWPIALSLDALIHVALMLTAARLLWEFVPSKRLTAFFLFISSALWVSQGRPDDLGVFFSLVAVAACVISPEDGLRRRVVVAAALTLSAAASPSDALMGFAATVLVETFQPCRTSRFRLWGVRILVVAVGTLFLCGPAFDFRYVDAFAQFRRNAEIRFAPSPWELLRTATWSPFILAHFVVLVAALCVLGRREWFTEKNRRWSSLTFAPFVLLVIGLVLRRHSFGFRLCEVLLLVTAYSGTVSVLASGALPRYRNIRIAAVLGLSAATSGLVFARIAVGVMAPLFWNEHAVAYDDCRVRLATELPKDATIGGDGPMCFAVRPAPAPICLHYAATDHWPEYAVFSRTLRGRPATFSSASSRTDFFNANYELIYSTPTAGPDRLLGGFGLTENFSDWSYSIWKRKPTAAAAPR